ncbi:MAG: SURF1 family protein [Burkholderiales bacterium]|nr:SURF1 family protein [Burkholderiales bacterium]
MARGLKGRAVLVLLAALVGAVGTARLGVWQLDRAAQKQALQARIAERATLPPLSPAALAGDAAGIEQQHYRRVRLQGHWLADRTVFLDNRQMNGRPGFFVLTPLRLNEGDAVLVQRGWVARDFMDRGKLARIATPSDEITLTGRVAPPPSRLFDFGGVDNGPIRQNLDLAAFSREIGLALRPLSVQQLDDGSVANDGLTRQWPAPASDVAKHHGYAFQWFALCALIVGLYVWFQLLRPRRSGPR